MSAHLHGRRRAASLSLPRRVRFGLGAALPGLVVGLGAPAAAQCQPVWSSPGGGVIGSTIPTASEVDALHSGDIDGPGPIPPMLYVGGAFNFAGSVGPVPSRDAAAWDGWAWHGMGAGITYPGADIQSLWAAEPGLGLSLPPGPYFGGAIASFGGIALNDLVRWDGGQWLAVPEWETTIISSGTLLSLWEGFTHLQPSRALHAGGSFELGQPAPGRRLAAWSGLGPWLAAGDLFDGNVWTMIMFDDDGPGERPAALHAAGDFYHVGGLFTGKIARFNGTAWEPVSVSAYPAGAPVHALCVYDEDGSGPQIPVLFAGGTFTMQGLTSVRRIARWDGQQWSGVGGGVGSGAVEALCVFDEDGDGPARECLYAGGSFSAAGGVTVNKVARWNGQQWTALAGGVTASPLATWVYALHPFDEDGPGPNPGGLYVGGTFTLAGTVPTIALARWGCPLAPQCYPNCNGDTTAAGAARLDVSDYICFQTKFALGDPYADCDANGIRNVNDYICFQTKFALGC